MKERTVKIISWILFWGYICVLVYFMFFAEIWGRTSICDEYSYNLIPFKEIIRFIKGPARAIRISCTGFFITAVLIFAHTPKGCITICDTGIPKRRSTKICANSCSKAEIQHIENRTR